MIAGLTSVADTSVVNLNAHLTSFGGSDFDVLVGEGRAGLPGDGGLLKLVLYSNSIKVEATEAVEAVEAGRCHMELTLQVMV